MDLSRVEVVGTSREDLNGLHGVVLSFDETKDRYRVQLDNNTAVSLKRDKFKPINSTAAPNSCAFPGCSKNGVYKCGYCKQVWYCGKDHQLQHWKSGHKTECRRAADYSLFGIKKQAIEGKGFGYVATKDIAVGAVVLTSKPCGVFLDRLPSKDKEGVCSNHVKLLGAVVETITKKPETLKQILALQDGTNPVSDVAPSSDDSEAKKFNLEEMAVEKSRIQASCVPDLMTEDQFTALHLIVKAYQRPTAMNHHFAAKAGLGFFLAAAWLNHSCHPNIVHFVTNEEISFRAVRPIGKGEEVCETYIPLLGDLNVYSRSSRQAELKKKFGFDCCCEKCTSSESELPKVFRQELALQEVLCVCKKTMALDLASGCYKCDENECQGRSNGSIKNRLDEIKNLVQLGQGRTKEKVTPDKAVNILSKAFELAAGFLGDYHGLRFVLNLTQASAADAVKDTANRLAHWQKCDDAVTWLLAPNTSSELHIKIAVQLRAAATRLEDRVRFSKKMFTAHDSAYGGGREFFEACYGKMQK
eukprot:CAMPEP_0175130324 /NCGR_PEP_ID=MMETSP0087-20121206/5948_1 /TAXON_ID=136419 /ORGANISM="Unknown Unknown, Strain D1" /LENGTH=528 /DNA_ID=CAMNT_0016412539 /DNA_START=114 /DNA_END=1700 /DNA_ORIENTATION=-